MILNWIRGKFLIISSIMVIIISFIALEYSSLSSLHGESFTLGDEVKVYNDGNILESYPAQVNKVYAIFIK